MRLHTLAIALIAGLTPVPLAAQSATNESAEVIAVVDKFHASLTAGDSSTALQLLADDAVLLEAGSVETRAEYGKNHLPADIEFEKGVVTKRSPIRAVVRGDAAWATSTSEVTGTFQGRAVDFVGAESMVLSREPAGWRIRAIHWSSRARRPSQ
jgi:ketosteroid isomerase-like protein